MNWSGWLAAKSFLLITFIALASEAAPLIPYETTVSAVGQSSATAESSANYAYAETAAFGSELGVGNSVAYASSESTLEVRGGVLDSIVLVDITFSMEVGTWKSANSDDPFGGSIASANSLIDLADVLDDEVSIWEAELDVQTTGGVTSLGDDAVSVVATISLLSGHDYIVALEAFAESWAIDAGWARAEATVDPTFAINPGQAGAQNFSLNHIMPAGSDISTVPEPTSLSLLGLGLIGIGVWARNIRPHHG